MKYLLDTHILLWLFDDIKKLSSQTQEALFTPNSELYVSIASAWEVAIKIGLGKLQLDGGVRQFLQSIDENSINVLPIRREYLECLQTLPLHHHDPFDRLLVATATAEDFCILTEDEKICLYGVVA